MADCIMPKYCILCCLVRNCLNADCCWTKLLWWHWYHYTDVIMSEVASQITSLTIVYPTVYSDADQRKHQNSASLAFVRGIHRGPVNFPYKWPVTRKKFPFDDVIMIKKSRMHELACHILLVMTITHWGHNKMTASFLTTILKAIFLNENAYISIKIWLKFVPQVRINTTPALVQIMAWHRPGDKPLFEPMINLLTHICVTRTQWIKQSSSDTCGHSH